MTAVPPDVYARLEALEAQVAYLAQHLGLAAAAFTSASTPDHRAEIVGILQAQGKIPAIKRYRELYGASLGEAKRAVEDLEASTRGPIVG